MPRKIILQVMIILVMMIVNVSVALAANFSYNVVSAEYDINNGKIVAKIEITNPNNDTLYFTDYKLRFSYLGNSRTATYSTTHCVPANKSKTFTFNFILSEVDAATLALEFNGIDNPIGDYPISVEIVNSYGDLLGSRGYHYNIYSKGYNTENKRLDIAFKLCSHLNKPLNIASVEADIVQKSSNGEIINKKHGKWTKFDTVEKMGDLSYTLYHSGFSYVKNSYFEVDNWDITIQNNNSSSSGYRSEEDARVGRMYGQSQASIDLYRSINGLRPGEW